MEPLLVGEQTAEKLKQLGAEEVYVGIGSCYTEKREIVFSYQQALYCSDKGKIEKTECSGIQQRAVEKEYALVSAGNGRKITGCYKKW